MEKLIDLMKMDGEKIHVAISIEYIVNPSKMESLIDLTKMENLIDLIKMEILIDLMKMDGEKIQGGL